MELPFELLDQAQLDAERAKLNKNIQENIDSYDRVFCC